ncbi:MAG: Crp/Fnr family transcriptional regulator [Pleomorphochaeta sp.]
MRIIQNKEKKEYYLNIFSNMLLEDDKSYFRYIKVVSFKKGEQIYYEGDKVENLYVLVDGSMIIAPSLENGKFVIIDYSNPGSMLGDLEYFSHDNIYHGVIAATDSIFISIDYKYIDSYFSKLNSFNYFLAKTLAEKLKTASLKQSSNLLYPFDKRLANYIIDLCKISNSSEIQIDTSTIAQYFGVTDRHYRRTLAKFESLNMVKRNKRKIIILDLNLLEQYGEY